MMKFLRPSLGLLPLVALLGVVAAFPPSPVTAQTTVRGGNSYVPGSMGIPQPEPKITLSVSKRSLSRILYEMFKQTRYDYRVIADVGTSVASVDLKQVPLTQALTQVLAQEKRPEPLVFYFTRNPTGTGTFTIASEVIQVGPTDGENRVSVANARITQILPRIFELMKVKGRIEPDVPPLCINLEARPNDWAQALPAVILEADRTEPGLTYSMDGDTYVVHLQKIPTGLTAAGTSIAGVRKVNLALQDVKLRDALASLFSGSSYKYRVADQVKDVPITFSASGLPEVAALHEILRQAETDGPQVTYREGAGGMFYIEPGPLPGEATLNPAANQPKTITLNLTKTRLKSVVASIENQAGITIKVAPTVPDLPINYRADKLKVEAALRALVLAAKDSLPGRTFRAIGTGYVVDNNPQ